MTAVVWIAVGHAGIHIRPQAAVAPPRGERGRSALGLDRRLRDREPDRACWSSRSSRCEERESSPRTKPRSSSSSSPTACSRSRSSRRSRPSSRKPRRGATTTGYKDRLSLGIRLIALVIAPAAIGYAVLARPLVSALIERGALSSSQAVLTGNTLAWFAAGLLGFSIYLFVLSGFYALQGHPPAVLPQRRRERDQHRPRHRVRGPMGRAGPRRLVRGRLHDLCGARDVVAVTRHGWPRPALARSRRRAPDRRRDRRWARSSGAWLRSSAVSTARAP